MNECISGTDVGLAQRSKLLLGGLDGKQHRLAGYSVSVTPTPDCQGSIKAATDNMETNRHLCSNKVQSIEPGTNCWPLVESEAKLRMVYVRIPLEFSNGNSFFVAECWKDIPHGLPLKNYRKDSLWSPICIFNIFTITFSNQDNQQNNSQAMTRSTCWLLWCRSFHRGQFQPGGKTRSWEQTVM